jgi:hypothetical protein
MSIKYHLSGSQAKEIERGKRLQIALPVPRETPRGLRSWAASVLVLPDGAMIESAEDCEITVVLAYPPKPDQHLTGVLGRILPPESPLPQGGVTLQVGVCVVEIVRGGGRSVRGDQKIQWPMLAVIDGVEIG